MHYLYNVTLYYLYNVEYLLPLGVKADSHLCRVAGNTV